MHNIDRTNYESTYGEYAGEFNHETNEYGHEFEGEYEGEYEGENVGEYEYPAETHGESPFSEAEEMELAAELLSLSSEAELEQFLGKLFKRVGSAVGKAIKSPIGRQLGGLLKGGIKKILPIAGSALGNLVLPGVGGAIGGNLASTAGSMLGLELEGLSHEDQEFEVARQVVRLAGAATANAAAAPSSMPPEQVAKSAVVSAAQQYAPGLLRAPEARTTARPCKHKQSGRWFRRGKMIILIEA